MSTTEILILLALAGTVAWWLDAIRTKEVARQAGRRACETAGVEFLDDTVVLTRLRLRRDNRGQLRIYREYRFEFASDGTRRYDGSMSLLGKKVNGVHLDPYRVA